MQFQVKELIYLPNLLTYLRFVFMPVMYYLLTVDKVSLAVILGLVAMLTDIWDGILARRLKQSSEIGKILDPLVDKITIALFSIYAVIHKGFPAWAAGAIIGRDLVIILLGLVFAGRVNQIPTSNFLGKITALSWGVLLVIYVLELDWAKPFLLIVCLILLAASVFSYARRFSRLA